MWQTSSPEEPPGRCQASNSWPRRCNGRGKAHRMRQARAWSCISPHVVPGMKPDHPQRVDGRNQRGTHHGKNKIGRPPCAANLVREETTGAPICHEEPRHMRMKPSCAALANPHTLDLDLYRPRRPLLQAEGTARGPGASDDTGPRSAVQIAGMPPSAPGKGVSRRRARWRLHPALTPCLKRVNQMPVPSSLFFLLRTLGRC